MLLMQEVDAEFFYSMELLTVSQLSMFYVHMFSTLILWTFMKFSFTSPKTVSVMYLKDTEHWYYIHRKYFSQRVCNVAGRHELSTSLQIERGTASPTIKCT